MFTKSEHKAETLVFARDFGRIVGIGLTFKDAADPVMPIAPANQPRNHLVLDVQLVGEYGFKRALSTQEERNLIIFPPNIQAWCLQKYFRGQGYC